jgi:hypothetical protein
MSWGEFQQVSELRSENFRNRRILSAYKTSSRRELNLQTNLALEKKTAVIDRPPFFACCALNHPWLRLPIFCENSPNQDKLTGVASRIFDCYS